MTNSAMLLRNELWNVAYARGHQQEITRRSSYNGLRVCDNELMANDLNELNVLLSV